MPVALRLQETISKLTSCLREPDFQTLYAALGDKVAHDLTRAANPEVKHCQWLTDSPVACEELPNSIGAEFAGKPCPNNPYHKYREQHEQFAEMRDLLEDAFRIDDIAELGLFPDLSTALPEEFTAARIMRQHRRAEDMQLKAQMSMLGGGSDG